MNYFINPSGAHRPTMAPAQTGDHQRSGRSCAPCAGLRLASEGRGPEGSANRWKV